MKTMKEQLADVHTVQKYWKVSFPTPIPVGIILPWVQAHDEKTIHKVIDYVAYASKRKGLFNFCWENVDLLLMTDHQERKEILAQEVAPSYTTAKAKRLIKAYMPPDTTAKEKPLIAAAMQQDISVEQLHRARKQLGIEVTKIADALVWFWPPEQEAA